MNKFIRQTFLFSLPIFIVLGIPVIYLFSFSENFKVKEVESLILSNQKYLIGYGYHQDNYKYLRWKRIKDGKNNKVLALGSSRVGQFRQEMFNSSFYNAGYSIKDFREFEFYLKSLPKNKYPEYLIIGIDQWFFSADQYNNFTNFSEKKWEKSFTNYPSLFLLEDIYSDIFLKKKGIRFSSEVSDHIRVGLKSYINNSGIREDGSNLSSLAVRNPLPQNKNQRFSETVRNIKNGIGRFSFSSEISKKINGDIKQFLDFCSQNEIYVIAFLPPFSSTIYELINDRGNHGYMDEIYPHISPIFKEYNFELYNFSNPEIYGSSDIEFLDGFHGSDVSYAKLLLSMLRQGSLLNNVSDSTNLKNDIKNPFHPKLLYDTHFDEKRETMN